MAFEIRKAEPYFPKRKPTKSKDYLSFLHQLPCSVTGRYGVQTAHVSFAAPQYGHYGRSKGTKAPDRWAIPLSPEEHTRQHSMSEREYWDSVGIDPHLLALVINGLFVEMGDDAVPYATAVINKGVMK
jgi:hypothetical protein